jgi:hypothetical protein
VDGESDQERVAVQGGVGVGESARYTGPRLRQTRHADARTVLQEISGQREGRARSVPLHGVVSGRRAARAAPGAVLAGLVSAGDPILLSCAIRCARPVSYPHVAERASRPRRIVEGRQRREVRPVSRRFSAPRPNSVGQHRHPTRPRSGEQSRMASRRPSPVADLHRPAWGLRP